MRTEPQLNGKVAIVTGGSRGIGLAIASALVTSGARVTIAALTDARLHAAAAELRALAPHARDDVVETVVADVGRPDDADRIVRATVERFGGLDILVNNAGVGAFAEVADQSIDEWRRVIETNLSGVFYCCRAAIPHLRRRGAGWIVNISSLAGKNPFASGAAYCASKAALNAFSEALMQELRYDDIRVACILPGSVATSFRVERRSTGSRRAEPVEAREPGDDWKLGPDDVAKVVMDVIAHDRRSLPSRIELRPSKPRK